MPLTQAQLNLLAALAASPLTRINSLTPDGVIVQSMADADWLYISGRDSLRPQLGVTNWHKYDNILNLNDPLQMASVSPKPILGFDARGPRVSNLNPAHYHYAVGEIPDADPVIDPDVKVSGTGSLKLTTKQWLGSTHRNELPNGDPANSGGYAGVNFSPDFSVFIGAGEKITYSWRQRCDQNYIATVFFDKSGNRIGPKMAIATVGDFYAGVPFGANHVNNQVHWSDWSSYKIPIMSQGSVPTGLLQNSVVNGNSEWLLQNALNPYCTWHGSSFPNCFSYKAFEWAKFKVLVDLSNSEFKLVGGKYIWTNSEVKVWAGHEGEPSKLILWWYPGQGNSYFPLEAAGTMGKYAGDVEQKIGKLNLMNFLTALDPARTFPDCHQWYDHITISRNDIPEPVV